MLNLKQENLRNEELKKELGKTLDKRFQLDFKKLSELKTFYEKMEPKRAAAILNKMENIQMLVAIISQLSPSKASLILEKMEPEKTVKISEIYVGFDKNKPDDLVNTICEIKNQGYDKE